MNLRLHDLVSLTDVEKGHQLRSRIAQKLNVPKRVRFAFSLAAALPVAFLNIRGSTPLNL
jgi:hypothetical protein